MKSRPDILVFLRCPRCEHQWHAATIVPGAWWAGGLTPEKTAKGVYCVRCNEPPPMIVVGAEQQPRLFDA
jgi:hypothetical protein